MNEQQLIALLGELDLPSEEYAALVERITSEGLIDEVRTEVKNILEREQDITDEQIDIYEKAREVIQERDDALEDAAAEAEAGINAAIDEGNNQLDLLNAAIDEAEKQAAAEPILPVSAPAPLPTTDPRVLTSPEAAVLASGASEQSVPTQAPVLPPSAFPDVSTGAQTIQPQQ